MNRKQAENAYDRMAKLCDKHWRLVRLYSAAYEKSWTPNCDGEDNNHFMLYRRHLRAAQVWNNSITKMADDIYAGKYGA